MILGENVLATFESKYAPARKAFAKWRQAVELAAWTNLPEGEATFSFADYVPPYWVFNVGGNKYRIIAKQIPDHCQGGLLPEIGPDHRSVHSQIS
jgi:mRNA interferase HigB